MSDELEKWQEQLYVRLVMSGRLVTQLSNRSLQQNYDIDHFMFFLMLLLHEAEGIMEQRVLVERSLSNKQSVTAALKRLEHRNMIHRQRSPDDGRSLFVAVTAEGERIFSEIRGSQPRKDLIRAVENNIRAEDGKALAHLLGEVIRNTALVFGGIPDPVLDRVAGMEDAQSDDLDGQSGIA